MQATYSLNLIDRGLIPAYCPPSRGMERFVEWLKNPQTSLLKRVGAVFLSVVALFVVAGVSKPAALLIGAGAFVLGLAAVGKANEVAQINTLRERSFARMVYALGGEEKYLSLPLLEATEGLPLINFVYPITRVTDFQGCPSIVLKLRDKEKDNHIFTMEFSFNTDSPSWDAKTAQSNGEYLPIFANSQFLKMIQDIVENKHPRFALIDEHDQ